MGLTTNTCEPGATVIIHTLFGPLHSPGTLLMVLGRVHVVGSRLLGMPRVHIVAHTVGVGKLGRRRMAGLRGHAGQGRRRGLKVLHILAVGWGRRGRGRSGLPVVPKNTRGRWLAERGVGRGVGWRTCMRACLHVHTYV